MDVIVETSGTTGAAKKVLLIEQANTLLAETDIKDLDITRNSVVALDRWGGAGVQKIYWAKLSGCRLAIYPGHEKISMRVWINSQGITHLSILATTFRWLSGGIMTFPSVKVLEVGGEMVDWADLPKAKSAFPNAQFINRYSCSEARVICRKFVQDGEQGKGRMPVGKPVNGVSVAVIDSSKEIVVSSPYMTDRYYDDPVLTAAKFRNGWYHTGDIGYWTEQGELMHCGRADFQIDGRRSMVDGQRDTEMTHDERIAKWTLAGG